MHRPRTARVKKARQRRWPGWVATDERWERMIAKIDEEVRLGKQTKNPPRYLTVEACWKRNVYAFALANTQSEAESHSLHLYTEGLISGNPQSLILTRCLWMSSSASRFLKTVRLLFMARKPSQA